MEKFFNIAGPCTPAEYYMPPATLAKGAKMRMRNEMSGRALVAGIIGAVACMVATGAYADAEPVRGRVAGMYYTLTTRTPQFPFLALWQVN